MAKTEEIIIAGFGGQGVLSMGQVLAYAAMVGGLETSWMPSYGPEMRGGTANCTVIISEAPISSPLVSDYDTAIVLNQPSLDKFESRVKPGGLLLYERSSIVTPPARTDIKVVEIPAAETANEMGKKQVANMIMVGAFLAIHPLLKEQDVVDALKQVLPERHHKLIPLNIEAFEKGKALAAEMQSA